MTSPSVPRPTRVVDAHVHLWDPANAEWYPYLSGGRDIGMGDVSGMARRFDVATHAAESAGWNVEKIVNVAAATGRHSVEETLAMDERARVEGHPDAIVGGLPPTDNVGEALGLLDRQAQAARLRGVRPMGVVADPLPAADVLRALAERGLVFEVMAHPDQLVAAARGLSGFDELTVVVEHTGWPRSGAPEERSLWAEGIAALAAVGPNVVCKISGLAMPLGAVGADAFRPWVEPAIEAFGVERCFFASNFPVDGLHGTFDAVYSAYAEVVAGLGDDERDALFATNAERVYRC